MCVCVRMCIFVSMLVCEHVCIILHNYEQVCVCVFVCVNTTRVTYEGLKMKTKADNMATTS